LLNKVPRHVDIHSLIKHRTMKKYLGVEVWLHVFFTSALGGNEWSASSRLGRLPSGNDPPAALDRWMGGPQKWSGRGGKENEFHPLPGIELWLSVLYPSHCALKYTKSQFSSRFVLV